MNGEFMPAILAHWIVFRETARAIFDNLQSTDVYCEIVKILRVSPTIPLIANNYDDKQGLCKLGYLGANSPDLGYYGKFNEYSDLCHYNLTGTFIENMLRVAIGEKDTVLKRQIMSYILGHISHCAADIVVHPYVNIYAGTYHTQRLTQIDDKKIVDYNGMYISIDGSKTRDLYNLHQFVEVNQDSWLAQNYFYLDDISDETNVNGIRSWSDIVDIKKEQRSVLFNKIKNAYEKTYRKPLKIDDLENGFKILSKCANWAYDTDIGIPENPSMNLVSRNLTKKDYANIVSNDGVPGGMEYYGLLTKAIELTKSMWIAAIAFYLSAEPNDKDARKDLRKVIRNYNLDTGYFCDIEFQKELSKKIIISFNHFWHFWYKVYYGSKNILDFSIVPSTRLIDSYWNSKEASPGDIVTLYAVFEGIVNETNCNINIFEYDKNGIHDPIVVIPSKICNGKIIQQWKYEFNEDLDEIPTIKELLEYKIYNNPPEYFFTVEIDGKHFCINPKEKLLRCKIKELNLIKTEDIVLRQNIGKLFDEIMLRLNKSFRMDKKKKKDVTGRFCDIASTRVYLMFHHPAVNVPVKINISDTHVSIFYKGYIIDPTFYQFYRKDSDKHFSYGKPDEPSGLYYKDEDGTCQEFLNKVVVRGFLGKFYEIANYIDKYMMFDNALGMQNSPSWLTMQDVFDIGELELLNEISAMKFIKHEYFSDQNHILWNGPLIKNNLSKEDKSNEFVVAIWDECNRYKKSQEISYYKPLNMNVPISEILELPE